MSKKKKEDAGKHLYCGRDNSFWLNQFKETIQIIEKGNPCKVNTKNVEQIYGL